LIDQPGKIAGVTLLVMPIMHHVLIAHSWRLALIPGGGPLAFIRPPGRSILSPQLRPRLLVGGFSLPPAAALATLPVVPLVRTGGSWREGRRCVLCRRQWLTSVVSRSRF
jgi:hypothetical protein